MIKWKTFQMSTSVFATSDQIGKAVTCVICVSVVTFVTFAMIKQTNKLQTKLPKQSMSWSQSPVPSTHSKSPWMQIIANHCLSYIVLLHLNMVINLLGMTYMNDRKDISTFSCLGATGITWKFTVWNRGQKHLMSDGPSFLWLSCSQHSCWINC